MKPVQFTRLVTVALLALTVFSGCTKENTAAPSVPEEPAGGVLGRPPYPTHLITWVGTTPQVFDVWNLSLSCSPIGTLQYGSSPFGILPLAQTATTLTVDGFPVLCGAPQPGFFAFSKGPNASTCGSEYLVVPRTGPANRRVLQVKFKGVATITFGSGNIIGNFKYDPATGLWSPYGFSGAMSPFCYTTTMLITSMPGSCC